MVSHHHSKHNPHPHQKPTVDQSQIRPSTSPSYLRIVLDFLLRHLNHPLSSILPTLLHTPNTGLGKPDLVWHHDHHEQPDMCFNSLWYSPTQTLFNNRANIKIIIPEMSDLQTWGQQSALQQSKNKQLLINSPLNQSGNWQSLIQQSIS